MSESEGDDIIVAMEVTPDTPVTEEIFETRSSTKRNKPKDSTMSNASSTIGNGASSSNRPITTNGSTIRSRNDSSDTRNAEREFGSCLRQNGSSSETNGLDLRNGTNSNGNNSARSETVATNQQDSMNRASTVIRGPVRSSRDNQSTGKDLRNGPNNVIKGSSAMIKNKSSIPNQENTESPSQSCQNKEGNSSLSSQMTDSESPRAVPAGGIISDENTTAGSFSGVDINKVGSTEACSSISISRTFGDVIVSDEGSENSSGPKSVNSNGTRATVNGVKQPNLSGSPTPSNLQTGINQSRSSTGNSLSESSPKASSLTTLQHPGNGSSTTRLYSRDFFFSDCDSYQEDEEGGLADFRRRRSSSSDGMGNVAGSIFGYSPLLLENDGGAESVGPLDELYVPITGYEVMEQRAKFTVFKLHVQKSPSEGYFIFRRYTDFTRLNNKLRMIYPGFRLSLPPKRWFGNNFDPLFLEDRLIGLQTFLNNVTGHKEIRKSGPVREFLCINDPPGPHDSLEESRVMVENLEEVAYGLKRELAERDRLLRKKDEEITRLKARIQELENPGLPELPRHPAENDRVGTDQESESSTVEGDRRSCVEADLSDHNDNAFSETENTIKVKVQIESFGKEPDELKNKADARETVAIAMNHSVAPVVGDTR